jgi:hypothetical protein
MGLEEGEEKEGTLYNQTPVDTYADSLRVTDNTARVVLPRSSRAALSICAILTMRNLRKRCA